MGFEAKTILLASVVGLLVGWFVCLITREGALFVHVAGAVLGAFVGSHLLASHAPVQDGSVLLQITSASVGAIVSALTVNRVLRD